MKKRILFSALFTFLVCGNIFSQKRDYDKTLEELLQSKKWFEAESFYKHNEKNIKSKFLKLVYKAETDNVFNDYNGAIDAYEQIIKENPDRMNNVTLISVVYNPLLSVYINNQEYDKAIETLNKMISIFENDTTVCDENCRKTNIEGCKQYIQYAQQQSHLPKMQITFDRKQEKTIELIKNKENNGIFFNAKWNGVTLRTFFDSGAGLDFIWNREVAEKIGVKINYNDTIIFNNGDVKIMMGTMDSLELGNFRIKNIPIAISVNELDRNDPRQVKCDSALNSMFDIVLGVPVMKKMGVIEFDFKKNTMCFLNTIKHSANRNLIIDEGNLLSLNMKVGEKEFLANFDTGSMKEGLTINSDFYSKYLTGITTENIKDYKPSNVGGCSSKTLDDAKRYSCPLIDIEIGNKKIELKQDCIVSKEKENDYRHGTIEGGALASNLFKYCKKATFDFVNMRFSIIPN